MKPPGTLIYLPPGQDDEGKPTRAAWEIKTSPDVMMRLQRIFPQADRRRTGTMVLSTTPEASRDVEWVLERWPFEISKADRERLGAGAEEHRRTETAVAEILSGDRPTLQGPEPSFYTPRPDQLVASDLLIETGRLLLADDLGFGKTLIGLLTYREQATLPGLVVCPVHLQLQWLAELRKVWPLLRAHIVRTLEPYDPSKRRGMSGHDPDVLIMSYSKLRGWGDHLAGKVRSVVFDEAHELRRIESDKYVAAQQIADQCDWRLGMTATPVFNYGNEIHNIMGVLAPDVLGTRSEFARVWCGGGQWSDKVAVKEPRALGQHLRDQGLLLRRRLEKKGSTRITHAIDFDSEVFERLTGDALSLAELIVQSGDKKEVWKASGEFDLAVRQATGISKAPYVADFARMLLEQEERLILFGWHRAVYDIWLERLEDFDPVLYTGSESANQKHQAKEAFVDGDSRVLIISLRSGAGLDGLQQACHIGVFGELDWTPAVHDQCEGRYDRPGQARPCLSYFLVASEGSDPKMAETLNVKRQQAGPLRDPDLELFQERTDNQRDRIREIAEDLLRRRGRARAA